MRNVPLAAVIVFASAGTLASAGQFQQRGAVSSVTVEPGGNDASVVLTVRGSNPCRSVSVDYGDGTVDTQNIGSLPATLNRSGTRELARSGSWCAA